MKSTLSNMEGVNASVRVGGPTPAQANVSRTTRRALISPNVGCTLEKRHRRRVSGREGTDETAGLSGVQQRRQLASRHDFYDKDERSFGVLDKPRG